LLSEAIGIKLQTIARDLRSRFPDLCIVADSEASYFIARMLLSDFREPIEVVLGSTSPQVKTRKCLVFVDAIDEGETLRALLQELVHACAVVCCIDLRREQSLAVGPGITLMSLIAYPFDPHDVPNSDQPDGVAFLEADKVTHIPEGRTPSRALGIGASPDLEAFVMSNPELFRYGIQRIGGRVHVATLSTARLIEKHSNELLNWIAAAVEIGMAGQVDQVKETDVVIFTRHEAFVKALFDQLPERLRERTNLNVRNVFGAILPFVPSGPRELFGRATAELFYGLRQLGPQQLTFNIRPSQYIAIYLDDACVTGKGLLNFLIRISTASTEQLPWAVFAIPVVSRFSPAEEHFYQSLFKQVSVASSSDKIPFSFVPLFHLRIPSWEKFEGSPLSESIDEISSRKPFLGERLQSYVAGVTSELNAALFPSESLGSSIRVHPYCAPHQFSRVTMISSRIVRIRHLIALQEQNVGVLSVLLSEIRHAVDEPDYDLMTMFALEPNLLETIPIQKMCGAEISELALRALSSGKGLETKSDALFVVFRQGQIALDRLTEILTSIGSAPELLDQFVVHLLGALEKTGLRATQALKAIDRTLSFLPVEDRAYVRGCLDSFDHRASAAMIKSSADALGAISRLIGETIYHASGWRALNALNDWLYSKEIVRVSRDGEGVREMVHRASRVVRRALLPGLDALACWSGWNANSQGRYLLGQAYAQLIFGLHQLEAFADTLQITGPIGATIARQLESIWRSVRGGSQIAATELFLSRPPDAVTKKVPPIERWLPEFFCLPVEIARRVTTESFPGIRVTTDWEKERFVQSVGVVPIPAQTILQLFELLFLDMQRHGGSQGTVNFTMDLPNSGSLGVILENQVRDDKRRTGKSQQQVKAIAAQYGFQIHFPERALPGEMYRTVLAFKGALSVRVNL
jgi:hypothetical protein